MKDFVNTDFDIIDQKHFQSMEEAGKANMTTDYILYLQTQIGADRM